MQNLACICRGDNGHETTFVVFLWLIATYTENVVTSKQFQCGHDAAKNLTLRVQVILKVRGVWIDWHRSSSSSVDGESW